MCRNEIGTSNTRDNFSESRGEGTTDTQYNFKTSAESYLKQQIALQKAREEEQVALKRAREETREKQTKDVLFTFQSLQAKVSKESVDSKIRHDFTLNFDELKKLAESGSVSAQFLVGLAFYTGQRGCIVSIGEGFPWMRRAEMNRLRILPLLLLLLDYAPEAPER